MRGLTMLSAMMLTMGGDCTVQYSTVIVERQQPMIPLAALQLVWRRGADATPA